LPGFSFLKIAHLALNNNQSLYLFLYITGNNGCLLTFTSSDWLLNILDRIGGVMVCVLASSAVDCVFEP
jgi:hypothetical protein